MTRHDTPIEIAHALAKHAPKQVSSILEPAVGAGALLEPFATRFEKSITRIVGIDIDSSALGLVRSKLGGVANHFEPICEDFLQWSAPDNGEGAKELFDCVVMNPPFSGRRERLVSLDLADEAPGLGSRICKVPIEVAFVLRAMKLLKAGGRLLAIVPSSLISSSSTAWIRKYLMTTGSIRYIHELPRFTFHRVEARVYLFVYERSKRSKTVLLCNHDLALPMSMQVRVSNLTPLVRLDYGFHAALRSYLALRKSSRKVQWLPISALANVSRGSSPSPEGARISL